MSYVGRRPIFLPEAIRILSNKFNMIKGICIEQIDWVFIFSLVKRNRHERVGQTKISQQVFTWSTKEENEVVKVRFIQEENYENLTSIPWLNC